MDQNPNEIAELRAKISELTDLIVSQNKQTVTKAISELVDISPTPEAVSPQEYELRKAELKSRNQKHLDEQPVVIVDEKGNFLGYNKEKMFAMANGYEAVGLVYRTKDITYWILDIDTVIQISEKKTLSGTFCTGYKQDKDGIFQTNIEAKEIVKFSLASTEEDKQAVLELKKKVGLLR